MTPTIRNLNDRASLDQLIAEQPHNPFLQTWAWGDFQSSIGRRVWRFGAFSDQRLVGAATVIEHTLILGRTYLYCPRGPIASSPESLSVLLEELKSVGEREGAMYVKADLSRYDFELDPSGFTGYTPGTTLQPRQTLIIDVHQKPSELLSALHQKTRYNIRLAEKRGVTVRWSTEKQDFQIFLDLIHDTYKRQGIRLHSDAYYQQLFNTLSADGMADIAIAEVEGQPLAANLVIWSGKTVTYLHGGSSQHHKELMAPHLVQWRTIERAHERGFTVYDLWGVAPADQPSHKWSGVTRFKRGFGGHVEVFPPAVNAVIQPEWYWAYRLAKRVRGGVDA